MKVASPWRDSRATVMLQPSSPRLQSKALPARSGALTTRLLHVLTQTMSPGEKVIGGWSSLCPPSTLNREPNAGLPTLQKWQLGTAGKKKQFSRSIYQSN